MLQIKQNLKINDGNGIVSSFFDTTGIKSVNNSGGYGTPNITYAQIGGVRLRIANYKGENKVTVSETGILTQYREYIKIQGASNPYDGKNIAIGNIFIPQVAGIVVDTGDVFEETGFYNPLIPPTRWKPNSEGTPLYLNGNELGLNTSGVIPNSILQVQYEVYGVAQTVSFTPVIGTSYLVTIGSVEYDQSIYNEGEVFIAINTSQVIFVDDPTSVSPYVGGSYQVYQLDFPLKKSLVELNIGLIENPKPKPRELIFKINEIFSNLYTVEQMAGLGAVSLSQAYDNLIDCTDEIEQLKRYIY